jgi:hypothetical protein
MGAMERLVKRNQQQDLARFGGYLAHGPAGGAIQLTEAGQEHGGVLVKAAERVREEAGM